MEATLVHSPSPQTGSHMSERTQYHESVLAKTKIIATVGPASESAEQIRELVEAGADLFRLNFAHGDHRWLEGILKNIRQVSKELGRSIAVLGDLSGPKIRLGELPEEGFCCQAGGRFEFIRHPDPGDPTRLTCTYGSLIDDLQPGDPVILADGTVHMRVVEKPEGEDKVVCIVEQAGCIRSRQGINLPGAKLSTPCLTDKDREDLAWALTNRLDFIGLSFVRSASDIDLLNEAIDAHNPEYRPSIVAKIEKTEAIADLEGILDRTDAVMVARGDLGVEADIATVPLLQKDIIRRCNQRRIPVITATQMLDSMHTSELPTRAEASDVANAVLDGTDAVMLSGESAIGQNPRKAVSTMSRICHEAEQFIKSHSADEVSHPSSTRATAITEAVTLGAFMAAEKLNANMIAVATHSGRTAMALSKQRSQVPIVALTDNYHTAQKMCLYWGVIPIYTQVVGKTPERLLQYVLEWSTEHNLLKSGDRVIVLGSTQWTEPGQNMMQVHAVK